jgi:hypothetical protein
MKRWTLAVSSAILLIHSTVWAAALETPNFGKGTSIDLELFKFPIEANPDSIAVKEKNREGEAARGEDKEKKVLDKKVDDAIKKALEDK